MGELKRRFKAGDQFVIDCMEYRVVSGRKAPGDLALEWRPVMPWQRVTLDHVALIVDAIADNENVLHPYPELGGGKVYTFVRQALKEGWMKARWQLHIERMRSDERKEAMR